MHVQYGMCVVPIPASKTVAALRSCLRCLAYSTNPRATTTPPPPSSLSARGGSINSSKLTIPGAGIERHLPQATQSKKKERRKREGGMVGLKVGGGGVCQDQLESLPKLLFGLDRKV